MSIIVPRYRKFEKYYVIFKVIVENEKLKFLLICGTCLYSISCGRTECNNIPSKDHGVCCNNIVINSSFVICL